MPDHYHWLTAVLASRGAQRGTSVTISSLILALGLLPILMIFSSAGPHSVWAKALVLVVSLGSVAIALAWRRERWPTLTQSRIFAVAMALSISAVSITMSNKGTGIVTCISFAALAAYVVFLHTGRALLWLLLVGAATIAVSFVRMVADGFVVWACYLTLMVVVVTVAFAAVSQALVQLLGITVRDDDVEPLTGLLNSDAIRVWAGNFIAARSRSDDLYLVLALVKLDDYAQFTLAHGIAASNRAKVSVAQMLRENTRRDALLGHISESEFLIIDIFPSTDATALTGRVSSAIRSTPPNLTASIGLVCTPMDGLAGCPPDDLLDEMIDRASSAVQDAQRSGGDIARHVICARLDALDRNTVWYTEGDAG